MSKEEVAEIMHYCKENGVTGNDFVPTPSFPAAKRCGPSVRKTVTGSLLSIELRTPNGTVVRIQGDLTTQHLVIGNVASPIFGKVNSPT